jgi:KaiC/GvpD/RAD55 family RecA-like ATPase
LTSPLYSNCSDTSKCCSGDQIFIAEDRAKPIDAQMPNYIDLPLLKSLLPHGIKYGSMLLIEFTPDSEWYELSLALAAQALAQSVGCEYHCLVRAPNEIRAEFAMLGLDVQKLEAADILRIIDDYSAQIGFLKKPEMTRETSMRVADWSILATQKMKSADDADRRRLHIDDNTSILSRYNKENEIVDYWRTRLIPLSRSLEQIMLHSLVKGVHSEAFYNQLESWHDGIVDVKSEEREGRIEHLVRVRILRGCDYDSKWRRLEILDNRRVTIFD